MAPTTSRRLDVVFSALFYSRPGPAISANKVFLNADVAPSLGRPLAGNAQNITVNMVFPGTFYGDRRNQLDLRMTKVLRIQRVKSGVSFEIYNVFNTNAVLTENTTYRDTHAVGVAHPDVHRAAASPEGQPADRFLAGLRLERGPVAIASSFLQTSS